MTVAAQTPIVSYIEDGTTTTFPAPFRYDSPADLRATRLLADGTTVELANGTAFTASPGPTNAGGTLTLTTAGPSGARLTIFRRTARTQAADYIANGAFTAESHEQALDKAMLVNQEQDVDLASTIRVPPGETGAALPAASVRAGRLLGFDLSGNPVAGGAVVPAAPIDPERQSLTLEQFGGAADYVNPGDRGTDNYPALMAALDAINRYAPVNSRWPRVPRIELPLGAMFFGQKVEQKVAAHLRGQGSGIDDFNGGTRFVFPTATQGWTVNSSNTIDGGIESPTTDALGTILEGIQFESEGGGNGWDTSQELNYAGVAIAAATNTYGLWVRSTSVVRNCSARGWKGNGAQIIAVSGGTGGLRGNANGTVFDTFTVREDGAGTPSEGHGFFVCGNDANACTFKDIRARHAGLMGILEIGTLGNTWINPRTDDWGRVAITGVTALKRACWHDGIRYILIDIAVGIGAATTPGTNANIWYPFEAAAAASTLFPAWSASDTYVAMLPMSHHGQSNASQVFMPYIETAYPGHAAGSAAEPGTGVVVYGGTSVWTPRTKRVAGGTSSGSDAVTGPTGFGSFNQPRPGTADFTDFGAYLAASVGRKPGIIWSGRTQRDGEADYSMRFTPAGEIVMDRGEGGTPMIRISTTLTARQFGRGANVPYVVSFPNFALSDPGDSGNDRIFRMGTAAPASGGPFARGERVFNAAPAVGQPDYWVCTVTGSPGTWVAGPVL